MKAFHDLTELPTPSLILDRSRLLRNVARMQARAQALKVQLRPHLKTAKSARVAELAHNGTKGPVTVSTLAEAAYFARHGFRDITYAVPIGPQKLDQVAALMRAGGDPASVDLKIITDHPAVAQAIADKGRELGVAFRVLIKIDCGLGRAGIPPDSDLLLPLAGILAGDPAQPGSRLAGVLTHAGHSYNATGIAEIERIAEEERLAAVTAATRLRAAGFACDIVSVGSTPTALFAKSLDGVTEMRPGNYVFFDLFQAALGTCRMEDVAVSVLAAVVAHHPGRNHFLIDAGGLALSKDTGANKHAPGTGYGRVCRPGDALPLPGLSVYDVHQEHGLVGGPLTPDGKQAEPVDFAGHAPGSRLRVLPNHVCMTGAMYDRYFVIDPARNSGQPGGGPEIVAEWDRVNGW
ncbi:MAG: alanine racemase [Ferrovibrio sp.]|uniref:alanine racemase n=1 Tax=Ferrovibrio sp. TaxID=1917215 RepID=UPI002631BCDC|nr:alanine racemase [Ferrovibrio sp.]MCW0233956.1 alanine racemase [Ferrovibrio sp.]